MKTQLTDRIVQRLDQASATLKKEFFSQRAIPVARYFVLDDLLPKETAQHIYNEFPKPTHMRSLKSTGECRLKYTHLREAPTLLQEINAAIQDPQVVAAIEYITEIKNQQPDISNYAGGISTLLKGHYINPHLDNSHDVDKKHYRTVNVLYYVSPNWRAENGGNYELWDPEVKQAIVVPSLFNRLVVMETNRRSWHGVNRVVKDAARCCVFNYFFSEDSPEGEDYAHRTQFSARPEQKIRRGLAALKQLL